MIVTLEQLKQNLRLEADDTSEDAFLGMQIASAQAVAEDFCGVSFDDATAPKAVRLAVTLMASHFYNNRENAEKAAYESMMDAFQALLWPHRNIEIII